MSVAATSWRKYACHQASGGAGNGWARARIGAAYPAALTTLRSKDSGICRGRLRGLTFNLMNAMRMLVVAIACLPGADDRANW